MQGPVCFSGAETSRMLQMPFQMVGQASISVGIACFDVRVFRLEPTNTSATCTGRKMQFHHNSTSLVPLYLIFVHCRCAADPWHSRCAILGVETLI